MDDFYYPQLSSAIKGFFIKKVKDIISGIPQVYTDPLAKLRERMAVRRCSLSLILVTEDEVMKVIKKIKPTTATGLTISTTVPSSWWLTSSHPPLPTSSTRR